MAAQRPPEARQTEFSQRNVLKIPCSQLRERKSLKHGTYRIGRFLWKTKGNRQFLWKKSLAEACAARARRWRIKPVLARPQDALQHPSLTDDIPNRDTGRSQRPRGEQTVCTIQAETMNSGGCIKKKNWTLVFMLIQSPQVPIDLLNLIIESSIRLPLPEIQRGCR